MVKISFILLVLISLLCYAMIVVLSIVPLDPEIINRGSYASFILYGVLFYIIGTGIHLGMILYFFDSWFERPEHKRKKYLFFILPVLFLAYMIYVMLVGT